MVYGGCLAGELALVANTGREEHIELVTCTQHPHLVNEAITGACTELVCFRLQGLDALRVVGKLGANKENVSRLPPPASYSVTIASRTGSPWAGCFRGPERRRGAPIGRPELPTGGHAWLPVLPDSSR